MAIINVSGNEFDVSEEVVIHHTIRKLRQEKEFLNTAIDNLRLEIVEVQRKRDIIQALIDSAKLAGATE
jgi:hypothetical protein